jgi:hypothetical protein
MIPRRKYEKTFNDPFMNNNILGMCSNIMVFWDPPWIAPDGSYIPKEQWKDY